LIQINLESSCNQDCVFCQRNRFYDPAKSPTSLQVKELIHLRGREKNISLIGGGEPTMREDLPKLIAYAKQEGFEEIMIETNAVRLSDISYLRALKAAGLTSCQISLHSHLGPISDTITGAPGTFRKTISGMENILNEGIAISHLLFTITRLNHSGMIGYLDFISSRFPSIRRISIGFIRPIPKDALSASHTPKLSEIELELYLAIEHGKRLGIDMTIMPGCDIPLCYLPKNESCSLGLSILSSSGKEESDRESHQRDRTKPGCCKLCKLSGICPGIFKSYILVHGEEEFYPLFLDKKEILKQASCRPTNLTSSPT
jgi:MoaA/NifB/PqqE/SkfB family radical SAM enzyme